MSLEDKLHSKLAAYMRGPQWVRSVAGASYRALPDRVKYGPRFADFQRQAARDPGAAPLEMIEARLDPLIRHAVTTVPAWMPFRDLADDPRPSLLRLRDLPAVGKTDIKEALPQFLSQACTTAERLPMFTGGSTANPMAFFLERGTSRPRESAYARMIDRRYLGTQSGDWTLSLRGRTVASATRATGRFWVTEPIKRHLILSSDHLEERYMPRYCEVLARLRPRLIHAFPSALYPLARWLADHPLPAFSENVRGILLTSENVYQFQEDLFRRVFPCPVIRHYGHSERAIQGVSLHDDSRYHFWPLYGLVELLDARGDPIEQPGQIGEIVATGFDNRVMPFIRYRTGDLGTWATSPGSGDRLSMVLERIEGRMQEFVVCSDRRLVSITTLGAAHFSELARVQAIQFEQREPGRLMLKVVAATALTANESEAIARAILEKTQGGCTVQVIAVPSIERTGRGKQRMLIQHLDLAGYFGTSITPQMEESLLSDA